MATFPSKVNYATGDVLTATNMNDVGGALNLLESAQYAAGKNKLINGDFRINQRQFTSVTTTGTYGFDRWLQGYIDGTVTYTPQTFTPGAAPVAGYEGSTYAQLAVTGQTLTTAQSQINQRIESVRTLAGQTATMSFWAKANTGTPNVLVNIAQFFGTGGSPSATVSVQSAAQAITTSWARYSFTIAIPSISGKTLGTTAGTDYLTAQIFVSGGSASSAPSLGIQNNTFSIWGVQLEAASTASPFQTASGSIAGELALCQRYFTRLLDGRYIANVSGTSGMVQFIYPVFTRTSPTITTNITNANYGSVWTLSQTGVATSTKTGTVTITTTVSVVSNGFALNLAGATYAPVPNGYESLSGAYFDISAEL